MSVLDAISITLIVLAVPICVVNLIFVILVYRRDSLGKLQDTLLFSLGCSDFCAGFFLIPLLVLCRVSFQLQTCIPCITSYLFNRFMMILSLLHLTAVISERYLKIAHPFWFQSKEYTLLRSRHVVPALWLTSLLTAVSPLAFWPLKTPCANGDKTLTENLEKFDFACLALFCFLLLFKIYTFVRLYLVVRGHLRDINATAVQLRSSMENTHLEPTAEKNSVKQDLPRSNRSTGSSSQISHVSSQYLRRQLVKKEAKIAVRFAAMAFMFILVWGAYFIMSFMQKGPEDVSMIVKQIHLVVRFLNPLLDPWILTVNNTYWQGSKTSFRQCRNVIFRGLWKCGSATKGRAHQATSKQDELQDMDQVCVKNTNDAEVVSGI